MGFFHVLALSVANIQHSISKNVLIIVNMGSLLKKKKVKLKTSETLQTRCRNAATFVWLPRHYHKGL